MWTRVRGGLCEFTLLESGNWQKYYEICPILNAPRGAGGASLCGRLIYLIIKDMALWFPWRQRQFGTQHNPLLLHSDSFYNYPPPPKNRTVRLHSLGKLWHQLLKFKGKGPVKLDAHNFSTATGSPLYWALWDRGHPKRQHPTIWNIPTPSLSKTTSGMKAASRCMLWSKKMAFTFEYFRCMIVRSVQKYSVLKMASKIGRGTIPTLSHLKECHIGDIKEVVKWH